MVNQPTHPPWRLYHCTILYLPTSLPSHVAADRTAGSTSYAIPCRSYYCPTGRVLRVIISLIN
ncbi:hypothetical protein RvY_00546 [Ramazzottius varieornatus]|uniref:Uncharacterized protein n=1 Tax=Ramazzottius varieornatus TaxID=947166 RepID=A0A1D1UE32_RAMVA|nr:hypothetical protein RvY_00546 [Ramazzottius varieornatus]